MATKPLDPFDGDAVNEAMLRKLGIVSPSAWDGQTPPAREWLLEPFMPWRKATFLTGRGQAGKSLLGQQLCTCVALGLPFLGVPTRESRALYVTCEDSDDELQRRQRHICDMLKVSERATDGRLWLASWVGRTGNELATFDKPERDEFGGVTDMLRKTARFSNLLECAVSLGVQFVVLDNVAHLFTGNENDRVQVAAFTGLMEHLALTLGCVLLIGHPNKAGAEYSGSTAWENQVRSRIYMEVPTDGDGSEIDADARVLSIGKANYAQRGAELNFHWVQGAFVSDRELGDDRVAAMSLACQNRADEEVFLRCLEIRTEQRRAVSENRSPTYAPTVFAKMPEATGIPQKRLESAMEALFRSKRIERAELWKGPDRKLVCGLRVTLRETGAGNAGHDDAT